jgi:hypothetical protein
VSNKFNPERSFTVSLGVAMACRAETLVKAGRLQPVVVGIISILHNTSD